MAGIGAGMVYILMIITVSMRIIRRGMMNNKRVRENKHFCYHSNDRIIRRVLKTVMALNVVALKHSITIFLMKIKYGVFHENDIQINHQILIIELIYNNIINFKEHILLLDDVNSIALYIFYNYEYAPKVSNNNDIYLNLIKIYRYSM